MTKLTIEERAERDWLKGMRRRFVGRYHRRPPYYKKVLTEAYCSTGLISADDVRAARMEWRCYHSREWLPGVRIHPSHRPCVMRITGIKSRQYDVIYMDFEVFAL